MNVKVHIPNAVTLLNLISGSLSVILLFQGFFVYAALLIGLSAVFDFLDGFFAKLLNVKSMIGKELDSLADVISFGLAPALFLFILISKNEQVIANSSLSFAPYLALLVAAFSALRLAKFNLDTRQTVSFLGLPTPANAVFIVSLAIVAMEKSRTLPYISELANMLWVQVAIIPLSCFLLLSEIPMFAMKFNKGFGFKNNKVRYMFLFIVLVCVGLLNWTGVLLSVIIYILLSLLKKQ